MKIICSFFLMSAFSRTVNYKPYQIMLRQMINLVASVTTPGKVIMEELFLPFGQLGHERTVLESAGGELGLACLVTARSAGPL